MQKARRHHNEGLRPLVSERFQDLFHLLFEVLFTFPSRYWFTIGLWEYLALPDGPGKFIQDFSCPALLRILLSNYISYLYGIITLYDQLSRHLPVLFYSNIAVLQPQHMHCYTFGLGFRVRSPLLAESLLFSSPKGT